MKIITDIDKYKPQDCVVTVGMFDGVHLGHKSLIRQLQEKSRQLKLPSAVLTFWPHPKAILTTEHLNLLNTIEERLDIFRTICIDYLIIIPFTKAFSQLSPQDFIEEYLLKRVHAKYFLMGYNHHFGKGEYTLDEYEVMAQAVGLPSSRVSRFEVNGMKCSSSEIRKYIQNGNIDIANILLGYKYYITGTIIDGDKIGRRLGIPTANLSLIDDNKLIPSDGVYACYAIIGKERYKSVANIGFRPTFKGKDHRIEVHILNYKKEIYGNKITIEFVQMLREESQFDCENSLKEQIFSDISRAQQLLK